MKSVIRLSGFVVVSAILLTSFMSFAAEQDVVGKPSAIMQPTSPMPAMASINLTNNRRLPSNVLDSDYKIHVESTDSKGNCPSGATLVSSCSGTYANGTSWSITPCCRTVTE